MKKVIFIFLVLAMLPVSARVMAQEPQDVQWARYMGFMDRFYFLDRQDFNKITCDVKVSSIDETLKQVNADLAGKIKVTADPPYFKALYNKELGLVLVTPIYNAELISGKGITNATAVVSMIRNGLNAQVVVAKGMLEGVFQEYSAPNRDEISLKSVGKEADVFRAVYETGKLQITDTYKDNTLESVQKGQGVDVLSTETFRDAGGKLIMKRADVAVRGPNPLKYTITVDYQKINNIFFPSLIENKSMVTTPGAKSEGQVNIGLTNCAVE